MDIDLKLKNRIKLGDKSAFEDIVGNFKKKIFYFCFDLTGSVLDAEDLSQDVFIKVFKSYSQFRGEASISSWLYRITLNTFLDQKRKISFLQEKKQLSIDENRFNDSLAAKNHPKTGPENFAESRQIQIHLQMALKRLTKKERSVFILRHYYGYKGKETASMLDISDGTVKSLLFRAIKKLQKELSFYHDCTKSGGVI